MISDLSIQHNVPSNICSKNGTLVATKETKVKIADLHSFFVRHPQIKKKNSWNNLNIYPADRSTKRPFIPLSNNCQL